MKKSIKKRIAGIFIAVMVAVLLSIGVFEYFFIDNYYYNNKQEILIESWNQINASEDGEITESFLQYCSANGLTYSVADQTLNSIYTNAESGKTMAGRLFGNILGMENENSEVLTETGDYKIIQIRDRYADVDYLELWGTLSNGNYYIVLAPVQGISDAARISQHFYIYIGLAALLIGALVIWFITSRIVEPIEDLSEQSRRMSELDFNARYSGTSEDEIGELGKNFNLMSDRLQKAIGELKSANARLEEDIEKKTQVDEMRKEFLANVSHELKTPIALIQGYAEGLKDNVNDDPESRDFYCDVIIDESAKMNNMVKQLLTLNQLEFGTDMISMERFDLKELIHGVLQSLSMMIEQADAKVLFRVEGPLYVWGDEFKIEEVVTNYITNALHHLDGERTIDITCGEENGIVTTTVFNSGKPIPADSVERIWDKFYKVDKARTRAYGGSGIGLSIVKAIMDQHHQKCWARNYDNGVAFSFTLESRVNL